MINEHIYPPDLRKLKFHFEDGGKIEEWYSTGINPAVIKSKGFRVAPTIDINSDYFEMKFMGHVLNYSSTSKFNNTVCNVYIVYKLNLYKNVEMWKIPPH